MFCNIVRRAVPLSRMPVQLKASCNGIQTLPVSSSEGKKVSMPELPQELGNAVDARRAPDLVQQRVRVADLPPIQNNSESSSRRGRERP